MTGPEFIDTFLLLEDNCAPLGEERKRSNRMKVFEEYWLPFKIEVFQRAVSWYLQHGSDTPFFPTLGELIAAQDASRVPPDAPPYVPPTQAEIEETDKFLASPEYKALLEKHGLGDHGKK